MSNAFWQAKIWGLLHDPALKALHNNTGRGDNSFWSQLNVMAEWREKGWNPEESDKAILKHIHLADYISSASDRGAICSVSSSVNYAPTDNCDQGLIISHLLSGSKQEFKIKQHQELINDRQQYLQNKERQLINLIPKEIQTDIKRLFWWLWRCLPVAVCREFQDDLLMLMPAENKLPDSSIWSHASLTAALAGSLAGYDLTTDDIEKQWSSKNTLSHPYLAIFSFTPVQEMIKASRKMRDFSAGSWILHYISAKVSWKLAQQYGPDSLLYPSLYQQPLIDYWLIREYPEFITWIKEPSKRSLLTAGFPNVLVLILPKDKVAAAMQTADQIVLNTWKDLGDKVFNNLHNKCNWMPDLEINSSTWKGWLDSQWQIYWTALPIGKEDEPLKNDNVPIEQEKDFNNWLKIQNEAYNLVSDKERFFQLKEIDFLRVVYQQSLEKQDRKFSVNVGSWWASIFDQTRLILSAVKNARTWQIPTAFGPRSTISGIGPVVHPGADWITESRTKKLWQKNAGLFDGREQLNASETLKRGLSRILPQLLDFDEPDIEGSYPDLTSGVAGYLKVSDNSHLKYFHRACQAVKRLLISNNIPDVITEKWGIPWIDEHKDYNMQCYHPRLLNSGWLVDDLNISEKEIDDYRTKIQTGLDCFYKTNNPTNWYVLAAGDGDGMSEWLKGSKMKEYREYTAPNLSVSENIRDRFNQFLSIPKRMGPSTHNALSRALLDFSNQLVPYITEKRYAGRLIYAGGDDVLAYTNLWEWDSWLWDIRECFCGHKDPLDEFSNDGDYWRWKQGNLPENLDSRPLFTMGHKATISFGIVIAHHSVPLAIALENLWEAEKKAKEHESPNKKDAVQVRVIYGNGNILKATSKFDVFFKWRELLNITNLESSIFEQAAELWGEHPAPNQAIALWTKAFGDRRDIFKRDESTKVIFQESLTNFLQDLISTTEEKEHDRQIKNWLKLAAFVLRNRNIQIDLGETL